MLFSQYLQGLHDEGAWKPRSQGHQWSQRDKDKFNLSFGMLDGIKRPWENTETTGHLARGHESLFSPYMRGGNSSGGFAPGPMGTPQSGAGFAPGPMGAPRWGDNASQGMGDLSSILYGKRRNVQEDKTRGGEYKRGRLIDAKPFSFGTT